MSMQPSGQQDDGCLKVWVMHHPIPRRVNAADASPYGAVLVIHAMRSWAMDLAPKLAAAC